MSERPHLVDIHNHLVPGVDDGARDIEESLHALVAMHAEGVRRLVVTPHLRGEVTLDTAAFERRIAALDAGWAAFAEAAAAHHPDIQVARGQEVMLDVPEPEVADARLRLAGSASMLVEFPRLQVPPRSADVLYQLMLRGVTPIIAHPERYVNLRADDLSLVEAWRGVGARTILNAGSLLGAFGREAEAIARSMLRRGWIDAIGSDYHARPGRPLLLRATYDRLVQWGGEAQATLLLSTNPARILDDLPLEEVPPITPPGPSIGRRLRRLFRSGRHR